ncbi:LysR family transcriptional regulator [Streptomyces sp. NPDC056568]|uniref:LysR family transcriptional regulator n=1 Tax=Streptomyces sp. NPDC056568 TaxID=3345866 RepID=UPI00369405B3
MDVTRLAAFLAVAEERHFGRAAERLHMSASPLSRHVAQLERELGGALFVREYHHVTLTPMGEALVAPVQAILDQVRGLPLIAAEARGQMRPLHAAATSWAPTPLVSRFASAVDRAGGEGVPPVELLRDSDDIVPGVLEGRVDLALLHLPAAPSELEIVPWLRYPLAVAVRADDPLARQESVSLAELSRRRLVNPFVPASAVSAARPLTAMLENAGVTAIGYVHGAPGGVEISREVLLRGLVTILPDLRESPMPSLMSPPVFAVVPVEDEGFGADVGLAWSASRTKSRPDISRRITETVEALLGASAA